MTGHMKKMGQREYRAALDRLGLTQERGAEFLGVSPRTSHAWANGSRIPQPLAMLLRVLLGLGLKPADPALNRLLDDRIE